MLPMLRKRPLCVFTKTAQSLIRASDSRRGSMRLRQIWSRTAIVTAHGIRKFHWTRRMKQRAVISGRVCPNADRPPATRWQPKNVQKWCVVPWPRCPRNYVCRSYFLNGSVLMNSYFCIYPAAPDTAVCSHWPRFPSAIAPQSKPPSPASRSASALRSSASQGRLCFVPPASSPSTAVCAALAAPLLRPSRPDSPAAPRRNAPAPTAHSSGPTIPASKHSPRKTSPAESVCSLRLAPPLAVLRFVAPTRVDRPRSLWESPLLPIPDPLATTPLASPVPADIPANCSTDIHSRPAQARAT